MNDKQFMRRISSSWPYQISKEKKLGSYRILALADSFGKAGGVNNYNYQLGNIMKNKGIPTEIVNISIEGLNPPDEIKLYRRFGGSYHPDLVLYGFYVGNDFELSTKEIYLYKDIYIWATGGLQNFLPRNLLFVNWLNNYIGTIKDNKLKEKEATNKNPSGTFSLKTFLSIERKRFGNVCRLSEEKLKNWKKTAEILDQIKKKTEEIGAQFAMVIHPDQFQVETALRDQIERIYDINPANYDCNQPREFLANYCKTRNIACLDLQPYFKDNNSKKSLYSLNNTHYNIEGNTLAAKFVADFLEKHGLIPHK